MRTSVNIQNLPESKKVPPGRKQQIMTLFQASPARIGGPFSLKQIIEYHTNEISPARTEPSLGGTLETNPLLEINRQSDERANLLKPDNMKIR